MHQWACTKRDQPEGAPAVWHTLSSKEVMSGEEKMHIACKLAGKRFMVQGAPRWKLAIMGLVVHVLRENMEIPYKFEHDYRFDSTKLEQAFNEQATAYRLGIKA